VENAVSWQEEWKQLLKKARTELPKWSLSQAEQHAAQELSNVKLEARVGLGVKLRPMRTRSSSTRSCPMAT